MLFSPLAANQGEHCLFLSAAYRDQIKKEIRRDDETALFGVRFGYEPIAPSLESTCFLGQSIDFIQVFYPAKGSNRERIKNSPAFDETSVRYDNVPENANDNIYCCFKQSLRVRVSNESGSNNELTEINEVVLDKKVYLSLFYQMGRHNNTLKLTQPFNLLEYKEEQIATTSQPTTTTISTTTTNEIPPDTETNPSTWQPTYRNGPNLTATIQPTGRFHSIFFKSSRAFKPNFKAN